MSEIHLTEVELACLSDEGPETSAEHLRWCASCRSTAADYGWLQRQIGTALATAADAVPVPLPQWRAVKKRLVVGRQRRIAGWRVSAVAGAVLAICVMLSVSPILGVAVTQTAYPVKVTIPEPVTVTVAEDHGSSTAATPTPIAFREVMATSSTPVLMPLPTPPVESEAWISGG